MNPVDILRDEIVNGAPLGPGRAKELIEKLIQGGHHVISDVQFLSRTTHSQPVYVHYEAIGLVDGDVWKVENDIPLAQLGATDDPVQLAKAAEVTLCKEYLMQLAPLLKMWQEKKEEPDHAVRWNPDTN